MKIIKVNIQKEFFCFYLLKQNLSLNLNFYI
jgi:hypothetical protein